jgi:recombination protein RecA
LVISLARPIHDPRLHTPGEALPREDGWGFEQLAGRLVQLEGAGNSAALTLAFTVVLEAQRFGEPAAWITAHHASAAASVFYPPDAHENGIDLGALPVVRVSGVIAAFSAADLLLRSGGFGLIVADLGVPPAVSTTVLARLAGLARRHHTAMIFLTQPAPADLPADSPPVTMKSNRPSSHGSLGSLISVHARAQRRYLGPDRFGCGVEALKDKSRGPAWQYMEVHRGAAGLR